MRMRGMNNDFLLMTGNHEPGELSRSGMFVPKTAKDRKRGKKRTGR
jgi:hypothetical protein